MSWNFKKITSLFLFVLPSVLVLASPLALVNAKHSSHLGTESQVVGSDLGVDPVPSASQKNTPVVAFDDSSKDNDQLEKLWQDLKIVFAKYDRFDDFTLSKDVFSHQGNDYNLGLLFNNRQSSFLQLSSETVTQLKKLLEHKISSHFIERQLKAQWTAWKKQTSQKTSEVDNWIIVRWSRLDGLSVFWNDLRAMLKKFETVFEHYAHSLDDLFVSFRSLNFNNLLSTDLEILYRNRDKTLTQTDYHTQIILFGLIDAGVTVAQIDLQIKTLIYTLFTNSDKKQLVHFWNDLRSTLDHLLVGILFEKYPSRLSSLNKLIGNDQDLQTFYRHRHRQFIELDFDLQQSVLRLSTSGVTISQINKTLAKLYLEEIESIWNNLRLTLDSFSSYLHEHRPATTNLEDWMTTVNGREYNLFDIFRYVHLDFAYLKKTNHIIFLIPLLQMYFDGTTAQDVEEQLNQQVDQQQSSTTIVRL